MLGCKHTSEPQQVAQWICALTMGRTDFQETKFSNNRTIIAARERREYTINLLQQTEGRAILDRLPTKSEYHSLCPVFFVYRGGVSKDLSAISSARNAGESGSDSTPTHQPCSLTKRFYYMKKQSLVPEELTTKQLSALELDVSLDQYYQLEATSADSNLESHFEQFNKFADYKTAAQRNPSYRQYCQEHFADYKAYILETHEPKIIVNAHTRLHLLRTNHRDPSALRAFEHRLLQQPPSLRERSQLLNMLDLGGTDEVDTNLIRQLLNTKPPMREKLLLARKYRDNRCTQEELQILQHDNQKGLFNIGTAELAIMKANITIQWLSLLGTNNLRHITKGNSTTSAVSAKDTSNRYHLHLTGLHNCYTMYWGETKPSMDTEKAVATPGFCSILFVGTHESDLSTKKSNKSYTKSALITAQRAYNDGKTAAKFCLNFLVHINKSNDSEADTQCKIADRP